MPEHCERAVIHHEEDQVEHSVTMSGNHKQELNGLFLSVKRIWSISPPFELLSK